ncbi:hypothetical protein [Rubrobacter radiotolerans]|uniref:Uncharacterized protein n=1 Tax=Rubrobacter radiotolerans TaxID=42256 RepID=A0AB35TD76_RUBRA|nr:hypothetical protein [Rubrobacter radiotolerans]MDX5895170.1 hypothetical protein [Rubrobacter radiotolerans]SMC07588.1 hypothetical protein SAMN00767673_2485 [Rubrobacter radiotolerans DSM 5868]
MNKPTERQAARAARQLYYHRQHLKWLLDRIESSEQLLLLYPDETRQIEETVILGGYRVRLCDADTTEHIFVEVSRATYICSNSPCRWRSGVRSELSSVV